MKVTLQSKFESPARCGLFALMLVVLMTSCYELVDADLPVSNTGLPAEVWEYAGSFGGHAAETVTSDNPWKIRFTPGEFREIAGVCATDSEVWVCDLGISRIQVFDFSGNLLREFGAGVSIRDTLLTDKELYIENRDFAGVHDAGTLRWEDTAGKPWTMDFTNLFKAADVLVTDEGYVIADQARSSASSKAKRKPRVAMFRSDGTIQTVGTGKQYWPAFLAKDGDIIALAERPGNALWIGEVTDEEWPFKVLTKEIDYIRVLQVFVEHANDENYVIRERLVTKAGSMKNEYHGLGGVAVAFDKVVACDQGNRRLQVMEGRREKSSLWGSVVRVVTRLTENRTARFDTPIDIDIDSTGKVFILDGERLEVAVLTHNFERIGSFGRGRIIAPWALDVSDDGNHCFITDQRGNQVHHYVRSH